MFVEFAWFDALYFISVSWSIYVCADRCNASIIFLQSRQWLNFITDDSVSVGVGHVANLAQLVPVAVREVALHVQSVAHLVPVLTQVADTIVHVGREIILGSLRCFYLFLGRQLAIIDVVVVVSSLPWRCRPPLTAASVDV